MAAETDPTYPLSADERPLYFVTDMAGVVREVNEVVEDMMSRGPGYTRHVSELIVMAGLVRPTVFVETQGPSA